MTIIAPPNTRDVRTNSTSLYLLIWRQVNESSSKQEKLIISKTYVPVNSLQTIEIAEKRYIAINRNNKLLNCKIYVFCEWKNQDENESKLIHAIKAYFGNIALWTRDSE